MNKPKIIFRCQPIFHILAPTALVLLWLVLSVPLIITIANNRNIVIDGPQAPQSQGLWSYIHTRTDPKAVIVFRKPFVMSLYGSRTSHVVIPLETQSDFQRVRAGYIHNHVTFFVTDTTLVSDRIEDWLRFFIQQEPGLTVLWQNQRYTIYFWSYETPAE